MPKNPNYDLRDKVLEFIKRKCMEMGIFSMSLADIAEQIGEKRSNSEKIMRTVDTLEKSGNIKVHRGEGSNSNSYEFIRDDISASILNAQSEQTVTIERLVNTANDSIKQIIDYTANIVKRNQELEGQILYYENLLLSMQQIGIAQDGTVMLKTTHRSGAFDLIIEDIQTRRSPSKK